MIDKLPAEIVREILLYTGIEQWKLFEYLFVCKAWYPVVEDMYFKRVVWQTGKSFQRLQDKLSRLNDDDNNEHLLKPFPMTELLEIDSNHFLEPDEAPNRPFTNKQLQYILSRFPNLKSLNLIESRYETSYMYAIIDIFKHIKQPQLEEIVLHNWEEPYEHRRLRELKFITCYHFRHSLKTLTAVYFKELPRNGPRFLKMLRKFKKLTTLEIYNDSDPDLTVFHLFAVCPNLSSLTYNSKIDISEDAAQQQLTSLLQELHARNSSAPHFLRRLKRLKLTLRAMPRVYIDFFLNHCPENLDDVDIFFAYHTLHQWMKITPVEHIHHLCKILRDKHTARLRYGDDSSETVRAKVRVNEFFQLWKILAGERVFSKRSLAYHYSCDVELFDIDFRFIGSEFTCHHILDRLSDVPVPSDKEQLAKVNAFMLIVESMYQCRFPWSYLKFVKKYCPQLREFRMHNCSWLVDQHCWDNTSNVFRAESAISSISTLEGGMANDMTRIRIRRSEFTEEVVDGMAEYFPKMEVLTVAGNYGKNFEGMKLTFELSKLKHLRNFVIETKRFQNLSCGPVLIQYKNNTRTVCYSFEQGLNLLDYDFAGRPLKLISPEVMQKEVETNEKFALFIEGPDQLTGLELRSPANLAKIDLLSDVIRVSF